jgi:beta-glucosidase
VKELRGFRKISLEPGQSVLVEFEITRQMLGYWNEERQFLYEPGAFDIMVGSSSADVSCARIWLS